MFFNAKKFHYLPLSSSQASNKSNIYINPCMDIIPQSTDVPDFSIIMSKDCSLDYQRLVLFYKIINGLASVETEDILTPGDSRTRKNHSFKFKLPKANCDS